MAHLGQDCSRIVKQKPPLAASVGPQEPFVIRFPHSAWVSNHSSPDSGFELVILRARCQALRSTPPPVDEELPTLSFEEWLSTLLKRGRRTTPGPLAPKTRP